MNSFCYMLYNVVTEPANWSLLTCVDRMELHSWCRVGGGGSRLEGATCTAGGAALAPGLQRTISYTFLLPKEKTSWCK